VDRCDLAVDGSKSHNHAVRERGPAASTEAGALFRSELTTPTPPTISQGATGPVVRWLQYLLVRRILNHYQIDGIFGPVTKAAVKDFQGSSGLVVDGIVGPVTWGALGGDGPEPPTLGQGSQGPVVQKLQTALNEGRGGGFAPPSNPVLVVDGIFGPVTASAVGGLQTKPASPRTASSACRHGPSQSMRLARCWPISAAYRGREAGEPRAPVSPIAVVIPIQVG
jgi:hypothetical protein